MRETKQKGIPVITCTSQKQFALKDRYGIQQGTDFDAHILKPYSVKKDFVPALTGLLNF